MRTASVDDRGERAQEPSPTCKHRVGHRRESGEPREGECRMVIMTPQRGARCSSMVTRLHGVCASVSFQPARQPRGRPASRRGAPRSGEAREAVKLLISASFTAPVKLSFVKLPEAEDSGQVHSFFRASRSSGPVPGLARRQRPTATAHSRSIDHGFRLVYFGLGVLKTPFLYKCIYKRFGGFKGWSNIVQSGCPNSARCLDGRTARNGARLGTVVAA